MADIHPEPTETSQLSGIQEFGRFVDLVRSTGLESVYVLIDRIDEPGDLANDLELAARFIAPLLGKLPLMEYPHTAFKFFLPTEMRELIMGESFIRQDRLLFRQLEWNSEALRALLKQRLIVYSGGHIEDLAALSDETIRNKIDSSIVELARNVPRNLLRIGNALFEVHCRHAEERLTLNRTDWEEALSLFADARPGCIGASATAHG